MACVPFDSDVRRRGETRRRARREETPPPLPRCHAFLRSPSPPSRQPAGRGPRWTERALERGAPRASDGPRYLWPGAIRHNFHPLPPAAAATDSRRPPRGPTEETPAASLSSFLDSASHWPPRRLDRERGLLVRPLAGRARSTAVLRELPTASRASRPSRDVRGRRPPRPAPSLGAPPPRLRPGSAAGGLAPPRGPT